MSVLVISRQMIADANEKASWFWKSSNRWEENGMCPTLAKMTYREREEFFLRLYYYNYISYNVRYNEKWTDYQIIEDEWEGIVKLGQNRKRIDIFTFVNILHCLNYNIEFSSMRDSGFSHPSFRADEKLLQEIINEINQNIVLAEIDKRNIKWCYS